MSDRGTAPAPGETTAADGITLAALQSQITDLKAELARTAAKPAEGDRVAQLEDALLSLADLVSDMRLAVFGSDRREDVRRVAAIAAAVRAERAKG